MIFYIATDSNGLKHVFTVEAEARKLDKSYVEVDQPNDKKSLQKLIQESYLHIHELEKQIAGSAPGEDRGRSQEQVPDTASESPASRQAEPSPPVAPGIEQLEEPNAEQLDVRLLEQQVSNLGIAGVDGLDRFDGWEQICGISPAFQQGVALLNIVCADDSAIAKIYLRNQIMKRIKARTY
jgi:hypothetical protein